MQNERFRHFRINAEKINRKNELIDGLIVGFQEGLQDIYLKKASKALVFAGDYFSLDPKEIVLAFKPEVITVSAIELFSTFAALIKDDILNGSCTKIIKKIPDCETENIRRFLREQTEEKNKYLEVVQRNYNLRSAGDNSVILTTDQYLVRFAQKDTPFAAVWTIRRYDNG